MDQKYLTVSHLTLKELQRFFSKIHIDPAKQWNGTPCWNWTACVVAGYGRLMWRQQSEAPHRLMYAWTHEPIPKGSVKENGHRPEIDHLCRNQLCCNPVHLELVDRWTNMIRGNGAGAINARKTHCKRGHFLGGDNLSKTTGGVTCKICRIRNNHEYKRRTRSSRRLSS